MSRITAYTAILPIVMMKSWGGVTPIQIKTIYMLEFLNMLFSIEQRFDDLKIFWNFQVSIVVFITLNPLFVRL